MTPSMRFTNPTCFSSISGLVMALALAGCSDDAGTTITPQKYPFATAPRPQQTIHQDIVKLIPRTASGLIHIRGPERLRSELAKIAKSIAPGLDKSIDIIPMIGKLGLRPRDLDLQRPGAVVLLTMPMIGGFFPMFALPVKDVEDAADLVEGEPTISGDYLGVSLVGEAPKLARKPSPLADAFPDGDLTIRLSLLKFLKPLRQQIHTVLDPEYFAKQQPDVELDADTLESMRVVLNGVKGLLGTARLLDLGISLEGGGIDLDLVLEVAKGSSWDQAGVQADGELAHLAQALPIENASLVFLSTPVWSNWMKSFQSVYQQMVDRMAPADGQAYASMLNRTKAIYDLLEVGIAGAVKFDPKGLRAAAVFASTSPQAMVEQFILLCDELDPSSAASAPKTAPGSPSRTFRTIRMDADARTKLAGTYSGLLGERPLGLVMAVEGRRIGVFCGNPNAASTKTFDALRSEKPVAKGLLADILPRLHATPELLIACDVRQTLRDIRECLSEELKAQVPDVPKGDPVMVWLALSSGGTQYEVQLHIDLAELIVLFK